MIWFGVHDTTLFASFPPQGLIGSNIYRYVPPTGWLEADNGIDFSKGNINLFAFFGSYFFASPGTAQLNMTTDNGVHWNKVTAHGPPYSNGIYLFGGLGTSIARSSDSGKTWERSATLIVNAFASSGNVIFASTGTGIWRSNDTGTSWSVTPSPLGNVIFTMMGPVIFALNGKMIRSTDSGTSWIQIAIPRRTVSALAASKTYVFAGTDSGVYVSLDSGTSWRNVSDGFKTPGPELHPIVNALVVFDTMLFADVDAGNGIGYVVARPISEMTDTTKSAVRVASVPELDSLEVYPNPASGLITIRGSYSIARVSVLNVLGAEVLNMPNNRESELTLDLSHFASGTYFLRIETAKGIVMRKVVRE